MHLNIYMHKMRPFSHVSVSSEQLPAVVPRYCQPLGSRAFSRGFTKTLAWQCRAFSRALKIEKLKAPLFPGPGGAGDANDWCINYVERTLPVISFQLGPCPMGPKEIDRLLMPPGKAIHYSALKSNHPYVY